MSRRFPRCCLSRIAPLLAWLLAALSVAPAVALQGVEVGRELERVEINGLGTSIVNVGDKLQIETAPGADGLTDRMSVAATVSGASPRWFVFALRNISDTRIERWLSADRYSQTGSGILWPRLDARQIELVTPSLGFLPENLAIDGADAFRLTIEPGQTVTFAVELSGDALPRMTVSRALDYEKRARNRQLFNGVLLGITGLLAIFLTAVFAANHKIIFPAAALFTWCVLAYLCVDFGFWHKLFNVRPEDNAQYRAATEAAIAATLLIFTHTFLRLAAWHGFARALLRLWILAQLVLIGVAFIDPRLAATFARLSMGGIFAIGTLFVVVLALRGQDRALSLVPTWMLLGLWITGMAFAMSARLPGDATATALTSGLVLIVLLIGFTVTQYAFRAADPVHAFNPNDQGVRLLALENSGSAVWEWSARRDEIKVGSAIEQALGLATGDLHANAQVFFDRMHPVDRDRLRQALDTLKQAGTGDLWLEFRLRHVDNEYRWFALDAATDPDGDARRARLVGLVREITDSRSAQERSAFDAVHDPVSGLPGRVLFLDRLEIAVSRAKSEPLVQPTVIIIDVDRIGSTATADRTFEADGLLITIARRLSHLVGAGETLARLSGDQFGVLILAQRSTRELQALVDSMRLAARALIQIGSVEITPKVAIGYAVHDRTASTLATDVLEDAEIAMHRARRTGRDEAVAFSPDLRTDRRDRAFLEADLREAIDKKQLTLQYQPIYLMRTQEIAGYEALVRWEHPRLGKLDPAEFVPLAEDSDLIVKLGSSVIAMAVADLQRWHATYERPAAPLTVSVNVSRRQLIGTGLVTEIRDVITRANLPRGSLRLEITETLVMENPEHATKVLGELAAAGAGLSLDDFGTGYSSLTYLNVFPFDTLKIDRALVHGSSEAGTVSAILRSVISLAHELGKKVVAEGIETEQDAAALRTLGCEYAQGFFYGTPQNPRDVMQALKELRKAERRMKRGGLVKLRERKPPAPAIAALSPLKTAAGRPQKSGALRLAQPAPGVGKTARLRGAPATTNGAQPPVSGPPVNPAVLSPLPPARPAQLAAGLHPIQPAAMPQAGPPMQHVPPRVVHGMGGTNGAVRPEQPPPTGGARNPMQRLGIPMARASWPAAAPTQAAPLPGTAAHAANASLAALGAQMAAPPAAPPAPMPVPMQVPMPVPTQPSRDEVPAGILNAMTRSISDAPAAQQPAAHSPAAPPPLPMSTSMPKPLPRVPLPPREPIAPLDLSALPPGIAASLARLAGQRSAPLDAASAAPSVDEPDIDDGHVSFTRPSVSAGS